MHKNFIYNAFHNNSSGKDETLNDILKSTKSLLASKNGFKKYISNYTIFTTKPTFKNPDITEYPLLKMETAFLIPIKNNNHSENNKKIRVKPKQKLFFSNEFIGNNKYLNFKEKYNKRFYQFLRLNDQSENWKTINNKTSEKRVKRYNSLFLDFFNKWNENNNNFTKPMTINKDENNKIFDVNNKKKNININISNFNVKERYSNMQYDENEIFNSNYDGFILNKICDLKLNKIKNFVNYIESTFNDLNEKEIYLKLESIKLNFCPTIKDKINQNNINNFSIYLPLSYVFLFYYNNFNFFQKLLMSLLYFDKDYKTVRFNDEELYNLLNTINTKENKNKEENDIDYLSKFNKGKKSLNESNNILKGNFNKSNILSYDKEFRKTFNKSYNFMNRLFAHKSSNKNITSYNENIKIKTIHSNKEKFKKIFNVGIDSDKSIETFYDEYHFLWETPIFTYKVKMEMPKIFFQHENLKNNIYFYCDKCLFLYLYKHNFINWDFYTLNYIFSIKSIRAFILKAFSLNKNNSNNKITNLKTISIDKNIINEKTEKIYLNKKKIFDQMSEKNESYTFFYSDLNLKNFLIHFYSYHIKIEYKKLNPKIKWEFFCNFKQMRYLNEISRYERLLSFLPKIIKTNFEYGTLDINFNVFDENFNAKILENRNREVCYIKKNNEVKIEINKPFLEIENNFKEKKIEKKELNYEFLRNFNKINMSGWSKNILLLLDIDVKDLKKGDNLKNNFLKNEKIYKIKDINNIIIKDSHKNKIKYKRNSTQKITYVGKKRLNTIDCINKSFEAFKSKDS